MLARLLISPVLTRIIAEYQTTKALMGVALTGMWAAYAILQFPSGVLGERVGERQVVIIALGLTAIGSLFVAIAPTFLAFAGATVAMGAGAGLYFSPATSLLTRLFEDTGAPLSMHSAGASVGGLLAPVIATGVAIRFGWREAVAVGALGAGLLCLLVTLRVPRTEPTHPNVSVRDRASLSVVRELLTRPGVAFTTAIAVTTVFAWQAIASFLPTFFEEYHQMTAGRASLLFALLFVVSTIALPVMGGLSDRLSRDGVLAAALTTAALALCGLLLASGWPGLVIATIGLGVGVSWGGVVQSRFMDRFTPDEQGTGFGLVRTVYMTVGASGSAVTGTVAGLMGWPAAVGVVTVLLGLGALSLAANQVLSLGL